MTSGGWDTRTRRSFVCRPYRYRRFAYAQAELWLDAGCGWAETVALKEFVPTRRPDGHEEYYSSLWELGGLSREALAKDWLPNAKS
jgi:hypothetical protein